jgi:hypothetical protein
MATRKRVLEKLTLTEISGVDRPCQEGARVTIMKRDFSAEQRKKAADSGAAMSDGSYPIMSAGDVANAVKDCNRTGSSPSVKAHIMRRAKAMWAMDQLPADWMGKSVDDIAARVAKLNAKLAELNKAWPASTHQGWGGAKRVGGGGGRIGRVGGAPAIGRVSSKAIAAHRLKVLALFHANRGKLRTTRGKSGGVRIARTHLKKSWDDAVLAFNAAASISDVALLKAGFQSSESRDQGGRWSAAGAAIGRGARAVGRFARTASQIGAAVTIAGGVALSVGQLAHQAFLLRQARLKLDKFPRTPGQQPHGNVAAPTWANATQSYMAAMRAPGSNPMAGKLSAKAYAAHLQSVIARERAKLTVGEQKQFDRHTTWMRSSPISSEQQVIHEAEQARWFADQMRHIQEVPQKGPLKRS